MQDPPTAVLFDFWGVIALVQDDEDVDRMAAVLDVPRAAFVDAYWAERPDYDAGGGASEYWKRVLERLRISATSTVLEELRRLDVASWQRTDEDMEAVIASLHLQHRSMALLSNAPRDLVEFVLASSVAQYLDPIILSCDVGLVKPNPQVYRLALRRMQVRATDVLFVDDNSDNVAAAQALGMHGLRHVSLAVTRSVLMSLPR